MAKDKFNKYVFDKYIDMVVRKEMETLEAHLRLSLLKAFTLGHRAGANYKDYGCLEQELLKEV